MCQLTFLHGNPDFVRPLLASLTFINAHDGNKDGHGYFVVPDHLWRISRSGTDAICDPSYFDELEKTLGDKTTVSIISHVRSASFNHKEVCLNNTHPFHVGHLILAHNGTLQAVDGKKELELENKIDSFWFLSHLAKVVGKANLQPSHIVEAMKSFHGKFAFIIFDMHQPTKVFLVRGKAAKLHTATVADDSGKIVCHVVNTDDDNISTQLLPHYFRAITKANMHVSKPVLLDEESIYVFDVKEETLTKCAEKIEETSPPTRVYEGAGHEVWRRGGRVWDDDDCMVEGYGFMSNPSGGQSRIDSPTSSSSMIDEICLACFEMDIGVSELNYLCELFTGDSILYLSGSVVSEFHTFVTKRLKALYSNQRGSAKKNVWELIKKKWRETYPDSPNELIELYAAAGIRFPWFTESKSGLKHVPIGIKTGKIHRQTSSAET